MIVRPDRDVSPNLTAVESDVEFPQQRSIVGPNSVGLNTENLISHGLDINVVSSDSGNSVAPFFNTAEVSAVECGPIVPKIIGRRKKKNKKSISELLYGDKASIVGTSDGSIADDDIEHRNSIIRKEAEATWEVSQMMGISFDCKKNNLIKVFMDLEQAKIERKENCA